MMSCGGNVSLSSFEEKFDERRNTTTFCHQKKVPRMMMESQPTEEN